MSIKNYVDDEFLYKILTNKEREIFARITALTFSEKALEFIEGKITGGSINIDGNSIVRRTCQLTLVAQELNITDFYWGLKNKFKLEIGLKNNIDSNYPDIIWFNQGLDIITSFNSSLCKNKHIFKTVCISTSFNLWNWVWFSPYRCIVQIKS